MKELKEYVILAQNGDKLAMQDIIQRFEPLIMKYYRKKTYDDDVRSELTLFLIELVKIMDLSKFKVLSDYSIINYVKIAMQHKYISLSKKQSEIRLYENQFDAEDIEEWIGVDENAQIIMEDMLMINIMKEKLSKREYSCVKLMVLDGLSSSEASKNLGITRQSVNEAKNRGLKKLRNVFEEIEKTTQ